MTDGLLSAEARAAAVLGMDGKAGCLQLAGNEIDQRAVAPIM
jgi:hypothetical protein